ncbi:MAG: polyhydroxyalkanoic acid system family protein [Myxococcota bacterium]
MSTVVVTEAHSLDPEEAKKRLASFEAEIAKYGMKAHWSGLSADLKGTGASGDVKVTGSAVTITVKLGMVAKMAGVKPDKLEVSLQKRLKEALA